MERLPRTAILISDDDSYTFGREINVTLRTEKGTARGSITHTHFPHMKVLVGEVIELVQEMLEQGFVKR